MHQQTFEDFVEKYVTISKVHPFREGNERSTRIRLDLILKQQIKNRKDRRKISNENYMNAMIVSMVDVNELLPLLK
jgi:cell filamentation protein